MNNAFLANPNSTTHKDTHNAWIEFLQRFRWDYFVTLTDKFQRHPDRLAYLIESRYLRRLAQVAQASVAWFYAVEHGHDVRTNAHLLVATRETLPMTALQQGWIFGFSDVRRYNSSGSAAKYATKTVIQPDAIWQISQFLIDRA